MVTDVVCLSEGYDLYAQFGRAFEKAAPEISLYRPDMVPDPMAVR